MCLLCRPPEPLKMYPALAGIGSEAICSIEKGCCTLSTNICGRSKGIHPAQLFWKTSYILFCILMQSNVSRLYLERPNGSDTSTTFSVSITLHLVSRIFNALFLFGKSRRALPQNLTQPRRPFKTGTFLNPLYTLPLQISWPPASTYFPLPVFSVCLNPLPPNLPHPLRSLSTL